MNIKDYERYREHTLKTFETRGFDGIAELSTLLGIPLVYCFTFILQCSKDKDVIEHCNFKIKELTAFYGKGIFNV